MDGAILPKMAPCTRACPAGIDVPRYVRHLRLGEFTEALDVIRDRIPFPLVCGHACFHPCETRCARSQFDTPVAIRLLKRVAAERGAAGVRLPVALERSGRRVAIVGSGPCGLTAAWFLALLGHAVTVFEALDKPGGMLRYGIPAYRLPDDVLDADLRLIAGTGVDIRTGARVAAVEDLLAQGFDAAFVASGAWRGARMGIPGEERATVTDGLSFLAAVSAGDPPAMRGERVIVVGGGNTAIDAARVSRRLGAEVLQIYRRTRADMPAHPDEIAAAIAEGVTIAFLTAPVRIEDGAVVCVRMALGPADASGRPRPLPVADSEHRLPADRVIVAIGQQVDIPASSLAAGRDGTIGADPDTLATAVAGIFAGGDAVSGPASVIDAIAHGQKAASAIDRFFGGGGDIDIFAGPKRATDSGEAAPRGSLRAQPATRAPAERVGGFALVEDAYDAGAAMAEAGRCLSCDLRAFDVQVNGAVCKECGYCQEVCGLDVFVHTAEFNAGGYRPYRAENRDACIGCLECLYVCPDFAITIETRAQ
jgi:NADPH-dependent glutamate synthase beta subunit-like oxidoreductase/NAD-dependent dihydropyrimidine dehydrogenase PreA subunit